jgi:hypothetical protein
VKAAKVDVLGDARGIGVHGRARVVVCERADGGGRAGDESHQRALRLVRRFGLAIDARLLAVVAKRRGRDLAAGVAVDARRIDVEIARDVSPASVVRPRPYGSFRFQVSSFKFGEAAACRFNLKLET